MGLWESVVVAVATVVGVFFTVMGFRGLLEAVESFPGRCARCGRTAMLPLPSQTHECWRCHHGDGLVTHLFPGWLQPRR
jgi:hypothetical protein